VDLAKFVFPENDALETAQKEWLRHYSKFDNPIDISFFKPYWIPIIFEGDNVYLDISNPNFPIFSIHYFFENWFYVPLIISLPEFLMRLNEDPKQSPFSMMESDLINEELNYNTLESKFTQNISQWLIALQKETNSTHEFNGKCTIFRKANPSFALLLPFSLKIMVRKFNIGNSTILSDEIVDIQNLFYVISSEHYDNITLIEFETENDIHSKGIYQDGNFEFTHIDKNIHESLKNKYLHLFT
jgi:hypothetical protein